MARRTAPRRATRKTASKKPSVRRSVKRPKAKVTAKRRAATARRRPSAKPAAKAKSKKSLKKTARAKATSTRRSKATKGRKRAAPKPAATPRRATRAAAVPAPHLVPTRLNRERRTLDDTIPTPPSSLNLESHGSAARTGRAEIAQSRSDHASMTPGITVGDVDVSVEDAYFSGDEAPGGDNPTPDQDVVDDIGKALGVEYQDDEELRASEKVADRDKHRWELDPASAEDYRERKQ